ncbi:DRMBL-domain-containing protein [Atractiella rhizophila]|nr:DRMBL-domain-containing protein [Atractiella rhizophila]
MQGHAEDKAWKSAAASEAVRGVRGDKRDVPFYKVMDGMEISVDAFRYGKIEGVKGYFLTHAHSDHYTNLSANWNHGPIYCSVTTANLIKHNLGVKDRWVKALPMNETVTVEGIKVTLLDANHCPGSVLFLFEGPHTNPSSPWSKQPNRIFRYLHCGDFRASPEHLEHEAIKGKKIDLVYLDTTYCNPKYVFPSQPQVIQAVSELISQTVGGDESAIRRGTKDGQNQIKEEALMKGWLSASKDEEEEEVPVSKNTRTNILILVGTYSIGKERVVKGIAKAIDSKIYCNDTKAKTFACIDDAELHSMLTKDPLEAQVHVTNLFGISRETLEEYLESFKGYFTSIIGLRPTGWTFKAEGISTSVPTVKDVLQRESKRTVPPTFFYPQRGSTDKCQLFGVPYSEHSSFFELSCFIVSANCTRIIPTVNVGSEKSRSEMKKWFERWKAERKRLIEAGEGRKPGLLVKPRAKDYW